MVARGEERSSADGSPSRLHYAWVVLAIGTLAVFGSLGLARFRYTVLLPTTQLGLGMDNAQPTLPPAGTGSHWPVMALVIGAGFASSFDDKTGGLL